MKVELMSRFYIEGSFSFESNYVVLPENTSQNIDLCKFVSHTHDCEYIHSLLMN